MKSKWIAIIVIALAAVAIGGLLWTRNVTHPEPANTAQAKDLYYCPMHKEYVSETPGNCPICSMKLVKKTGSDEQVLQQMKQEAAQAREVSATTSDGNVFIAPQRQQMLGVRTAPVVNTRLSREIRTVGKIAYDETRITHIHTKFNGWVEQVYVNFVGQPVKRGQPLFTIYSPELVSTQEEYLLALQSQKQLGKSSFDWIAKGSADLTQTTRSRLQLWGISENEINNIARTGKTRRALTIYSPVSGIVTQRAAYHHGLYVTPEAQLYTIVDLSTVWLLADVYEKDLPFIKPGQKVRVDFPYGDQPALKATIDYFYPFVDPNTRTGQVRIALSNPRNHLKPDQFVNVVLHTQEVQALVVPNDSILNTGQRQYAFVELGGGYFEPRDLQIGMQTKEGIAVDSGLKEGERVVTSANFLLDSEANLRGVLENMGKPQTQTSTQQPRTSALNIQLVEPRTAKSGDNRFWVSVKHAEGGAISATEVEVALFMPAMGSMPPMSSRALLLEQGNGMYAGSVNVPMAGTWQTTITVRKDNRVLGVARTTVTAR